MRVHEREVEVEVGHMLEEDVGAKAGGAAAEGGDAAAAAGRGRNG
jgi:hypothetical protein